MGGTQWQRRSVTSYRVREAIIIYLFIDFKSEMQEKPGVAFGRRSAKSTRQKRLVSVQTKEKQPDESQTNVQVRGNRK